MTRILETTKQNKSSFLRGQASPFLVRALREVKVQQKIRLCGLLSIGAGLIPTLILLWRLRPGEPGSVERGDITSLVVWTVVVQTLGLLMAALIGRQVLADISNSLRRLGDLVNAIRSGDGGAQLEVESRNDEIGSLAEALQQMIAAGKEDRQKLIQGNVALVLANERLAQTNMELEAASAKVRQLAEQAGAANVAKRDFLAVMSHEIRTPINGIIGMTELALKTPLSSGQRDYIETVNNSAQGLLELLNDILDFSKIEAGKLELELVDFSLRETLEEALAGYASRFHAKGLELILDVRPDVPDALVGDPHRLRQVVLNLVGNALRFTEKGEVVVRAEISQPGEVETMLRFTVTDSGCGISADKRETIFDAFTQADNSTTRRFGGTGLGLAICKQLVHLMGGWISVQSEIGRGSEFQFRARFGVGAVLTGGEETRLQGRRALVVDAHPLSAKLLAELMTSWKMEVEIADNADAATVHLAAVQSDQSRFDFVIADTLQPESRGFELAMRLGEMRGDSPMLVLMLSSSRREDVPPGIRSVACFSKPLRAQKLRAALIAALEGPQTGAVESAPLTLAQGELPHGRRLRVLVAEDNATNQRIVRTHLQTYGHEVVTADDGQQAIDCCSREVFDLIFMDLQMPKLDGVAATRIIREKEPAERRTPIVALTANVLKGVREECLAASMDGYLGKPVREQDLLGMMESLVLGLRPLAHGNFRPALPAGACMMLPAMEEKSLPFDAAALLESVNGNRETLVGLLRDSRDEDIPELVTQLSTALAAVNLDGVKRAAHAIKGVVGVFHAPAAYQAAKRLEDSARNGKREILAEETAELLRAVFDLLSSLEKFLSACPAQGNLFNAKP